MSRCGTKMLASKRCGGIGRQRVRHPGDAPDAPVTVAGIEAADAAEARRDGVGEGRREQDRERRDRAAAGEPRPRARRGMVARQEHRPAYGSMRSRPENGPKTAPIGPARRPADGRRPGPLAGCAHPSRARRFLARRPARDARSSSLVVGACLGVAVGVELASRRWPRLAAWPAAAWSGVLIAVLPWLAVAAAAWRASPGSVRWRGCRGSARSPPGSPASSRTRRRGRPVSCTGWPIAGAAAGWPAALRSSCSPPATPRCGRSCPGATSRTI